MKPEDASPLSKEDALASLAQIDSVMTQTRKNIAAGSSGPIVILWGVIWIIGYGRLQFFPHSTQWLWPVLDAIGFAGSVYIGSRSPVKSPNQRRVTYAWLVLFAYAMLWVSLLSQRGNASQPGGAVLAAFMERRIVTFFATVPMFAYVIMGLWLDRFFIWLGALVTVVTLVGCLFVPHYFYLWLAVTGGGSMIVGGVFIRKFWR